MTTVKTLARTLCLLVAMGSAQTLWAAENATTNAVSAKEEAAKIEAESLAPTAKDMAKAKEERAKGHVPPRNNERETKIEAVRDQNNRVTEYVVTPGMTHIPYSMENQAERPISSTPGSNSQSTLGNTKQFKIGF